MKKTALPADTPEERLERIRYRPRGLLIIGMDWTKFARPKPPRRKPRKPTAVQLDMFSTTMKKGTKK